AGTNIADGGTKDFGSANVGSNTSLSFTIKNVGSANLTGLVLTKDNAGGSDFTLGALGTTTVVAGASTTFTVTFAPGAVGSRTTAIHLVNNDADENPFDITLTGTGVAVPEIAVEQPLGTNIADGGTKDFGSVNVGSNTSLSFTIKNTGTASLTGLTITKDGTNAADFTVTANPVAPVSGPSGTTTFTVQFAPGAAGARTAAIHLASNDADENPFDITLTGTGIAPEIAVEQPAGSNLIDGSASIGFGSVLLGSVLTKTFTVTNLGTANLSGLAISTDGTNASDFTGGGLGATTLAPGTSTTFSVTFGPGAGLPGLRTATLHLSNNDADENPFDITLSGTAVPNLSVAAAIDQPGVVVADGGQAAWFGQTGTTHDGSDAAQSGDISHNQRTEFSFTAAGSGTISFWWKVSSESSYDYLRFYIDGTEQSGSISGTVDWQQRSYLLAVGSHTLAWAYTKDGSADSGADCGWVDQVLLPTPEIAIEQPLGTDLSDGSASRDFGGVPLGSTLTKTFTVKNLGTGDLTRLVVIKDGSHAADFTVSALGATTLVPGASTTFSVSFVPGGDGWHSAAIHLASNDDDENPFDISLSGLGYTPDEFASTGGITIPSAGLSGTASPYPSTIAVSGVMGSVSALRVKLTGVSHTYPDDLDLFLVSPGGQVCALMSDAGGPFPLTNLDLAFADDAASAIPDASAITAGTYRPANHEPGEALPPGGTGAIGTNLLALTAGGVNGTWKLFASDDYPSIDGGSITSWSLVFEQTFSDEHGDSFATATPLPAAAATSGTPGLITPGDEDFFRMTVPGPGILIAWSEGATDTYGYLYGNDRSLLDEDDNNDLQANFRTSAGVVAGDYFIRVRGGRSNTNGGYTLRTRFIPSTEPIQVSYLEKTGNDVNLGFTGSAGELYYIQGSDDFQDWTLLATMTGTGAENYATLPGQGLQPQRYFRVGTQPPAPAGFALIPASAFQMGNALAASGDGYADELPVHSVNVSAFYLAKYEVTKALWDEVRTWGLTHGYPDLSTGTGKAATHPVHSITWYDMVKWCNAHSEKVGLTPCYSVSGAVYRTGQSAPACNWAANGYRLPTEAEWEKAARGGASGKRFPWGDTINHTDANYHNYNYFYESPQNQGFHPTYNDGVMPYTSPTGSFAANGYGLYDLAGNVWEWCWDWYGGYAAGSQTDPRGATSGTFRVFRGGCWNYYANICRVAFRYNDYPAFSSNEMGFRLARSAAP
ncbi:MAG: choice-of-anchor D domain-containing protein, partial [Verrucomicrobia bacterium]|nr:choice-of-anchor D domain-containing protein [Verrucomicrobiota bacterium]